MQKQQRRRAGRPKGPEKVKLAVYLTPEASRALRHLAVDAGKPITEIVSEAVEVFLKHKRTK